MSVTDARVNVHERVKKFIDRSNATPRNPYSASGRALERDMSVRQSAGEEYKNELGYKTDFGIMENDLKLLMKFLGDKRGASDESG